ncbi:MAG: NlpC/P60 family protein [Marinobacter sp.]
MRKSFRYISILCLSVLTLAGCASNQQFPAEHNNEVADFSAEPSQDSAKAEKLWQVFKRYQGAPYRYGGTSANGFDCSGFILTAYQEGLGKQLPRTTSQMLAHGDSVPPDNIEPGDLVFFRIGGKDQHAGIYMGDDRFIHASTSIGVTQSSMNGYYWKGRFTQARRFD